MNSDLQILFSRMNFTVRGIRNIINILMYIHQDLLIYINILLCILWYALTTPIYKVNQK